MLYLSWASSKVDTHGESARSNQSYRRYAAAVERWKVKRTTEYFNTTNVSANRLGRLGCWIVVWQSFELSLVKSNWSPFWTQAQRFLLPAQPPFLLFFPRPITPHSGSSEPPRKNRVGEPETVSRVGREPSGMGSHALEFEACGNPRARSPWKIKGAETLPQGTGKTTQILFPSHSSRPLALLLEVLWLC